eukprot:2993635-Pyramimonas_sp.AAC.1
MGCSLFAVIFRQRLVVSDRRSDPDHHRETRPPVSCGSWGPLMAAPWGSRARGRHARSKCKQHLGKDSVPR